MHEGFVANMPIVHLPVRSHRRTRMQLSIIAWCNSFYATDTSSLRTCLPLTNSNIKCLITNETGSQNANHGHLCSILRYIFILQTSTNMVTQKVGDKHTLQLGSQATYHIFLFKKNAIFNPQWFTRNYHNILPFYQLVQLDVPLEIL